MDGVDTPDFNIGLCTKTWRDGGEKIAETPGGNRLSLTGGGDHSGVGICMLRSLLSYSSHIFSAFLFPLEVQLSLLTVLYWPVSRCALGRVYCGGSRLAGGLRGCFRKKLAESWFIAFGVGVIGEGLGGFHQRCSALL